MTDEELRQKYGIQLASRPVDSGDGKEAKWADIDDDEDDWAPETIEWNDGTKINLAQVDSSTPTTEQTTSAENLKEVKQSESAESKPAAPKLTSIGPKATVLKLGSSAPPKPSPVESPSSAKPATEKPTLVAKPSPAPPPKNPWAPLPPVDKIPLVTPPLQQPQPRMSQDLRTYEGMPPPLPSIPAKEIAADDFSRLPRDSANGTPRELFNSQSGRYEPVPEGRRMSKRDQGFRTPAVLQRPAQTDAYGPAEPSPAFQTTRSQQDAAMWRRRRASSNVSGENGIFARRMSMSKGPVETVQRRDSQLEQPLTPSVSSAKPSQRDASPAVSHGHSVNSQSPVVSVVQTLPQEQDIAPQVPATPGTPMTPAGLTLEEVKMQKTMMKEKAEAAHKRRIEEEKRQEAEKKERLRLKMEKLGLTDEVMRRKEAESESAQSPKAILKDIKEPSAPMQAAPAKAVSPPKPPIPVVNGEPQQYGLMKVHAPQARAPSSPGFDRKPISPSELNRDMKPEVRPTTIREPAPILASVNQANPEPLHKQPSPVPTRAQLEKEKPVEYPSQRLTPAPPSVNGYPSWGQHSMATHSAPGGNVWAPPANHKALGNGDFQKRVHISPTQQPYPPPPHLASPQPQPQPIGTPRQPPHNKPAAPEAPIVSLPRHVDIHPQSLSFGSNPNNLPSEHLRPHSSHLPPPLDQDIHSNRSTHQNIMPQRELPKTGMDLWKDFSKNAAVYDAKAREKATQEHAALLAEQQKAGKPLAAGPVLNETWNQVIRGDNVGARRQLGSVQTQRELANHEAGSAPPVRSRYQDIFDQTERTPHSQAAPPASIALPSPPAEVELHPVFGSTQRPVVNLPGSKVRITDDPDEASQRPIVRLPPPKALSASGASTVAETRMSLSPLGARPLIANPTWQDRINGLLDRKAIAEKKLVDAADFSVSKPAADLFSISSTSVALPPQDKQSISVTQTPQKNIEDEDALFEERDFGSVPTVRVPAMAPPPAWNPAKPYANWKRVKAMALSDAGIYSGFNYVPGFEDLLRQNDIPVVVKIAGMATPTMRMLPRTGSFKQTRTPYNSLRRKPQHGFKGREPSTPMAPTSSGQLNGRQNGQQASGQRKTSGTAGQSWARRVSATAQ